MQIFLGWGTADRVAPAAACMLPNTGSLGLTLREGAPYNAVS